MGMIFTLLTIRGAMLLMTIITTVSVMIPEALFPNQTVFDPFAPYADLLPGQTHDSISHQEFDCQFDFKISLEESCLLTPEIGEFSEIIMWIAQDTGRIKVSFKPREKTLSLGDLMLLWGKPEVAIYGQTANLRWRHVQARAVIVSYKGHFSHLLPIALITFEAPV